MVTIPFTHNAPVAPSRILRGQWQDHRESLG